MPDSATPHPLDAVHRLGTAARLGNRVVGAAHRLGLPEPALEPAPLLRAAERTTGLSDWGDDGFREGLAIMLDGFRRTALTPLGRWAVHASFHRLLRNRLELLGTLRRCPSIADEPVQRPLFITGLPRTGTTLLHNLFAEDPSARVLRLWELRRPTPPPGTVRRRPDPRIRQTERELALMLRAAPHLRLRHPYRADGPEECILLFQHGFASYTLRTFYDLPGYLDWLRGQDLTQAYAFYRRQLQLLQWRRPRARWVLKAPAHLYALGTLLRTFPDARVVHLHRDPCEVVPSFCSFIAATRPLTFRDRPHPAAFGRAAADLLRDGLDRAYAVRDVADPAPFCDVEYADLVADPVATVRSIYAHFGEGLSAEAERRMRAWLAEHPQHKHGVHRYALGDFGLTRSGVEAAFGAYAARRHRPSAAA